MFKTSQTSSRVGPDGEPHSRYVGSSHGPAVWEPVDRASLGEIGGLDSRMGDAPRPPGELPFLTMLDQPGHVRLSGPSRGWELWTNGLWPWTISRGIWRKRRPGLHMRAVPGRWPVRLVG